MGICIGVDCDEVLSETIDELLKHSPFKEKNLKMEEITSYYFRDIEKLEIDQEQGINIFFSFFRSPYFFNCKTVKGSYKKLKELKECGHKLVVVTARSEEFKDRTISWVETNFPGIFSDFLFMNQFSNEEKSKAELCKEHGIQVLIDDNIDNIINVNEGGIPGILLDKPWNRNAKETDLLKRIHSWDELDIKRLTF